MSATVHGLHNGNVVLEEDGEVGQIPGLLLDRALRIARNAGRKHTTVNGRYWSVAALVDADDTWRDHGLVELPDCTFDADGRECDQPALTTDLRDRPVCLTHAPDDDARSED